MTRQNRRALQGFHASSADFWSFFLRRLVQHLPQIWDELRRHSRASPAPPEQPSDKRKRILTLLGIALIVGEIVREYLELDFR